MSTDIVGQHIDISALRDGYDGEPYPLGDYIYFCEVHQSGQLAEFDGVSHISLRFPMVVGAEEMINDRDRLYVAIQGIFSRARKWAVSSLN
jgi:hypothetical protein